MARAELPIVVLNTTTGLPVSGASVAVKYRSSGLAATWWTQETGGTSSTASITTDASGRTSAWLDRGAYNCTVSGTGITTYTEPWDSSPGADGGIDSLWLPDNVIQARHLADKVVSAAEIADDTITASQIAAGAVGSSELGATATALFLRFLSGSGYRIAWGSTILGFTGTNVMTTSGNIAHGLGATPQFVFITPETTNTGMTASGTVQSKDATNIVIRGVTHTSGIAPNWNVTFNWAAIG